MDSEQILSQIKEKVGQTNLSDQTLTDYIGENMPADGVEPDEAYFAKHVKVLKSLNGNFSKSVADTVKTQVTAKIEEFKKNYKPAPTPSVENPPKGDDELAKRLEALEQAYAKEKKTNVINSLKSNVKAKAETLKVARKSIWDDVVDAIEVPDDATEDTLLATARPAYEAKLKSYLGEGASPYQGNPTPPKNDGSQLDDFFARKAEQGKMPKKN